MKKLTSLWSVLIVLTMIAAPLFAGGGSQSGSGTKTRELKLAHFGAEESAAQTAAKQFADNVERRTNGALKITLYPNNVLGGPPQILEQVLMGTVDMSLSGQDQLAKHVPLFDTVAIPFSTTGYDHMDRILDGPFLAWAKPEVEKKGAVMLSSWEWGFRQITNSKHPILSPEDVGVLKSAPPRPWRIRRPWKPWAPMSRLSTLANW